MEKSEGGLLSFRMEEEEQEGWGAKKRSIGFGPWFEEEDEDEGNDKEKPFRVMPRILSQLLSERELIINNDKYSTKEKQILLAENMKAFTIATGGKVTKTDSVVYGILVFGGIVLVTLALLTTYANLPSEVTLSFVGTVLGGTIATIAQKLGKI